MGKIIEKIAKKKKRKYIKINKMLRIERK